MKMKSIMKKILEKSPFHSPFNKGGKEGGFEPVLLLLLLTLSSCGTFGQGGNNSQGSEEIIANPYLATFDATEGEDFHKFPITNNTNTALTITQISFSNNYCNAFSFFNLVDENENFIGNGTPQPNYRLPPNSKIYVQTRFSPFGCSLKRDYETALNVYFRNTRGETGSFDYTLRSEGIPPSTGASEETCTIVEVDEEELNCNVSGQPSAGTYYLRDKSHRAPNLICLPPLMTFISKERKLFLPRRNLMRALSKRQSNLTKAEDVPILT